MNRATERRVESPVALFCVIDFLRKFVQSRPYLIPRAHLTIRHQLSIIDPWDVCNF